MKFLLDQDVFIATAHFLRELGHDVVRTAEIGLSGGSDEAVLAEAAAQERIFVTRDRDFGGLVFLKSLGSGVIYLRLLPSNQAAVHAELARMLDLHPEAHLQQAFVVVQPNGHRFRKLPSAAQSDQ